MNTASQSKKWDRYEYGWEVFTWVVCSLLLHSETKQFYTPHFNEMRLAMTKLNPLEQNTA